MFSRFHPLPFVQSPTARLKQQIKTTEPNLALTAFGLAVGAIVADVTFMVINPGDK